MTVLTNKRMLSNILLVLGLLLVLGAAASLSWEQVQASLLQSRLSRMPPASPAAALATREAGQPGLALAPSADGTETPPAADAGVALVATGAVMGRAASALPATTAMPIDSASPSPSHSATAIPASPPVRLVIPDLNLDVEVTDMTWTEVQTAHGVQSEWQIPQTSAGHAVNSARLGEPGNIVISGHNNIYGRVFMAISEAWGGKVEKVDKVTERSHLLDGRVIELYAADGRRFDYVISDFLRVLDSGVPLSQRIANAQYIDPGGPTRLTITTCWPPWSNTHRLVVVAEPLN